MPAFPKSRFGLLLILGAAVALLLAATIGPAATPPAEAANTGCSLFLRIQDPDIPGDSRDSGHRDWIDLTDYTLAGPRLTVNKGMDRASPQLAHAYGAQTPIEQITLHLECGRGNQRVLVQQYVFGSPENPSTVVAWTQASGGERPTEEVTFAIQGGTSAYTPLDDQGRPQDPIDTPYVPGDVVPGTGDCCDCCVLCLPPVIGPINCDVIEPG